MHLSHGRRGSARPVRCRCRSVFCLLRKGAGLGGAAALKISPRAKIAVGSHQVLVSCR